MRQRYSEGYLSYQGRSPCLFKLKEKSAEVIVVADTSHAHGNNMEVSQSSEGPNIKLFSRRLRDCMELDTAMH